MVWVFGLIVEKRTLKCSLFKLISTRYSYLHEGDIVGDIVVEGDDRVVGAVFQAGAVEAPVDHVSDHDVDGDGVVGFRLYHREEVNFARLHGRDAVESLCGGLF